MKITVPDGSFEAYVARPAHSPAPAVIVIQEIFGVNQDIRQTCSELAEKGYVAIAPDLFWREAPGLDLNAWSEADWAQGFALYQAYDRDRGIRDIAATIEAARTLDGVTGKVGITGFCLGGLMTFLTASRVPVDAAVAYYGGGTEDYLATDGDIEVPLLMHLGAEDEYISQDAQARIQETFAQRDNVTVHIYPGCSHAFARHTGTHYDADAAALANARTADFFTDALGAG